MHRRLATFVLIDAAFEADRKFKKLRLLLPDEEEFNSAVGAWLIGLATSRRSGSHLLDIQEEVPSRFRLQLIQAGLLTPEGYPEDSWGRWAPKPPTPQSLGGQARAAKAVRQADGTFGPSSRNQQDQRAGSAGQDHPAGDLSWYQLEPAGSSSSALLHSSDSSTGRSSPPSPTSPPSEDDTDLLELLAAATGRTRPSPKTIAWGDELVARYGKALVLEAIRKNLDKAPRAIGPAAQWLELQDALEARRLSRERDRQAEAARDRRISEQRRQAEELRKLPQPARSFGEIMGDLGLKIRKAES